MISCRASLCDAAGQSCDPPFAVAYTDEVGGIATGRTEGVAHAVFLSSCISPLPAKGDGCGSSVADVQRIAAAWTSLEQPKWRPSQR